MESHVYCYRFDEALDTAEVEATLNLAVMSTESLHGESRVRLEARHRFDTVSRSYTIDASGEVGMDLNRLFLRFITREFGLEHFQIARVLDFDTETAMAKR